MNENPTSSTNGKYLLLALKLAAVLIGSSLLLSLARREGLIGSESVERAVGVLIALVCAAYCNVMPKLLGQQPTTIGDAKVAQALGRVSGWAMTLAFLASAALWAFGERGVAQVGSIVAVGASGVVVVGYACWKYIARFKFGDKRMMMSILFMLLVRIPGVSGQDSSTTTWKGTWDACGNKLRLEIDIAQIGEKLEGELRSLDLQVHRR